MDEALTLRERFSRETETIVQCIFGLKGNTQEHLRPLNIGLQIIRVLSKKNPRWLLNNPVIADKLYELWCAKYSKLNEETVTYQVKNETIIILKILVEYCQQCHTDLHKLFGMVRVFEHRAAYEFTFLRHFYKYYIDQHYSVEEKRGIFNYFLEFSQKDKT
jgi:hypothetical protein